LYVRASASPKTTTKHEDALQNVSLFGLGLVDLDYRPPNKAREKALSLR
jgi:hypothetical protein